MVGRSSKSAGGPLVPSQILFLSLFFLIGTAVGTAYVSYLTGAPQLVLDALSNADPERSVLLIFWKHASADVLLLFAVLAASFSSAAAVITPICMAAKGFVTSSVCCAYVSVFGAKGYITLFSDHFFPAFFTTACIFLMALQALYFSDPGNARRRGIDAPVILSSAAVSLLVIAASAAARAFVNPLIRNTFAAMNF